MAYKVSEIEVSNVGLGDIKEFKTSVAFRKTPITYNGKPLIILTKCIATLFENKDSTKNVCGYSLRMQDLDKDFISKIESITNQVKNKVRDLEHEIKKVRKRKLHTEELSIFYNKEAIFEKNFFLRMLIVNL